MTGYAVVRAVPDSEPVEINWSACVYADWITEELKEELADDGR